MAAHYRNLTADLLLTGIVLHDIGKIDELCYDRGIDYTTQGRLLGHITIGAAMVREKIRAIPNFPAQLAMLVEHLILSHHGSYEFGSPSLPQTREAVALHFLDDMDSKMGSHSCDARLRRRETRIGPRAIHRYDVPFCAPKSFTQAEIRPLAQTQMWRMMLHRRQGLREGARKRPHKTCVWYGSAHCGSFRGTKRNIAANNVYGVCSASGA